MNVEIIEVPAGDARLVPLLAEVRAELDGRYPEEIGRDFPRMHERACYLLAVLDSAGVGCCAVQPQHVIGSGPVEGNGRRTGELKRMYVVPGLRGRGLAKLLLAEAEARASRLGYTHLVLETGIRQPEAIGLYRAAGFTPIPNYPPYDEWDLSRCFVKSLA